MRQIVVVSDMHCGCSLGLMPEWGARLDNGQLVTPSPEQRKVWAAWVEFWREWVPENTKGELFSVVVNGDAIDGRHHQATTQWSHNLADQTRCAKECLDHALQQCEGAPPLYWVRGTEAHVGPSGENEESLAQLMGAVPTAGGLHSRHELRIDLDGALVDIQHHISPTGSNAYETTALQKEFAIACEEAGRWGQEPPDVIVRSHRHRLAKTEVPTQRGSGIVVTTPGWQLKTPFTYRLAGARQSLPQFGGILVRHGDGHIYTKHRVWCIDRAPIERLA